MVKRNGRRVPFDRDKLVRSVQIALRKRPVEPERVEQMVSASSASSKASARAEISSETIGEMVMERLRKLDDVAYVRFASVYRNFREAKDFEAVLGELSSEDEARPALRPQMIFRILEDRYAERAKAETAGKAADLRFMRLALALGRRGLGRTAPNPAVGAVLRQGRPSSSAAAGPRPAAGRMPRSRRWRGPAPPPAAATLYVTLEPCSHHGRTPPCADAVIAAGIARVVSAIEDPNPRVAGRGHAQLRAAGIAVDVGIGAERGRARPCRAYPPRARRPAACRALKLAVSTDDKIGAAAATSRSRSPARRANARVHLLRAQSDAILVGIGTVLADDPQLTVRLPGHGAAARRSGSCSIRACGSRRTADWCIGARDAAVADRRPRSPKPPSAMRLGAAGAEVIHVADRTDAPGSISPRC